MLLVGCTKSIEQQVVEQLELGKKYLEEENYEEAIVAFNKVIDLEPKEIQAYISLANVYIQKDDRIQAEEIMSHGFVVLEAMTVEEKGERKEDIDKLYFISIENYKELAKAYVDLKEYEQAMDILKRGIDITTDKTLEDYGNQLMREEIKKRVSEINIPFTVDQIELNVSDISEAKEAYMGQQYVYSNLMMTNGSGTYDSDTVYLCYGMNGTPIPEGYEKDTFGFIFCAPVSGGPVNDISICEQNMLCFGAIRIGMSTSEVMDIMGLYGLEKFLVDDVEWMTDSNIELKIEDNIYKDGTVRYACGNSIGILTFRKGKLWCVSMRNRERFAEID